MSFPLFSQVKFKHLSLWVICISIFQNIHALSPDSLYRYTPDSLGLSYENIQITTEDSFKLHAWLMTPAPVYDKKTTLIISGGDAGNMGNYVYQSYLLVMQGYTVISYDYRGFGTSDSFKMKSDMLYYNEFVRDLKAVIAFSKSKMPTNKTGLLSYSMGTIISVIAVQNVTVDFMIMEGLVYNPLQVSARLQLQEKKLFYVPDSADKVKGYYNNILCPMLIFAGEKDHITSVGDAKMVCALTNNRQLAVYNGAHLEGLSILSKKMLGDLYLKRMLKFLKKI